VKDAKDALWNELGKYMKVRNMEADGTPLRCRRTSSLPTELNWKFYLTLRQVMADHGICAPRQAYGYVVEKLVPDRWEKYRYKIDDKDGLDNSEKDKKARELAGGGAARDIDPHRERVEKFIFSMYPKADGWA